MNKGVILMIGFYVALFFVMWLIIMFPQKRADKKKRAMLDSMQIGDEVITIAGIHGRVNMIRDNDIIMQFVDDKAKVKIEKWAIKEISKRAEGKKKNVVMTTEEEKENK